MRHGKEIFVVSNMSVFEQVAAGKLDPKEAAEALMAEREQRPRRPSWMPDALYRLALLVLTVIAPALVERRS